MVRAVASGGRQSMAETPDLMVLGDGPGAREIVLAAAGRGLCITWLVPPRGAAGGEAHEGWPWPFATVADQAGSAVRPVVGRACLAGRGSVVATTDTGTVVLAPRRLVLAPRLRPASPSWWVGTAPSPRRPEGTRGPARIIVLGAGHTGVEAAAAWADGRREVLLVESSVRILPDWDAPLADAAHAALLAAGVGILVGRRAVAVEASGTMSRVTLRAGGGAPDRCETADLVVAALGWRPELAGLGVERTRALGDRDGFLQVDSRFETAEPGLHALGGALALPLTPQAVREQVASVVDVVAGREPVPVRFGALPRVIERPVPLLTAGLSAAGAATRGFRVATGRAADGAAWARCVLDADTGSALGVQAAGPGSGDLADAATSLLSTHAKASGARADTLPPLLAAAWAQATAVGVRDE